MLIIDGVEIAYDEQGPATSAPAVVFVHAGVADRRMWEHQFRARRPARHRPPGTHRTARRGHCRPDLAA
jgi:pimeloyl-ACP methyl ester carboxylesterase